LVNDNYFANYRYFQPGPSASTPGVKEQHIPYMDNAIVCEFTPPPGPQHALFSLLLDYYRSNGATHNVTLGVGLVPPTTDSYEHFFALDTFPSNIAGPKMLETVDDTLNLLVTRRIEDTFPVPPNYRSPYYRLSSGRMEVLCAQQLLNSYLEYKLQDEQFGAWGMSDLNIQQYGSFPWHSNFMLPSMAHAGPLGCKPATLAPYVIGTDVALNLSKIDPSFPVTGQTPPTAFEAADLEFKALAGAARSTGALFAHGVAHPASDPWGSGNYPGLPTDFPNCPAQCSSCTSSAIACLPSAYPIQLPYAVVGTHYGGPGNTGFGLMFPATNPGYVSARMVRGPDGVRKPGWDYRYGTLGSSWQLGAWGPGACSPQCPPGFASEICAASYYFPLFVDQLGFGIANFSPNCVRVDASSTIPDELGIDQIANSGLGDSAREVLRLRTRAFRDLRTFAGGPLYGEAQYWRHGQSYDHGVRDGYPWGFPPFDDGGGFDVINGDSWVIPDYNLREVLAKAGGTAGVDSELRHLHGSIPFDGPTGDADSFIDSWITTAATYGNNAFTSSNGHNPGNYWTYQGILRNYFMLNGYSRRIRECTLQDVRYVDSTGAELGLADAIASPSIDLTHPRIHITWKFQTNKTLHFYANHDAPGPQTWLVTIPNLSGGSESVFIGPNGFAAGDGEKLLAFFNAKPGGYGELFDYAEYVGVYKLLNCRRPAGPPIANLNYRNFPTPDLPTNTFTPSEWDQFRNGLIVRSDLVGKAIGAVGGFWDNGIPGWKPGGNVVTSVLPSTPPVPQTLAIEGDTSTLHVGKTEGFVAIATYSNSGRRDVTGLVGYANGWSITPGLATVNQSGGVTALVPAGPNSIVLSASWGTLVATRVLSADPGAPTGSATVNFGGFPGDTAELQVLGAADPKGGPLDVVWNTADGSPSLRGARVLHTYRTPASSVTTAAIGDVEENESVSSANVLPTGVGSILFGDDFGDGRLDGWKRVAGWWGNFGSVVRQSKTSAAYAELAVVSTTWPADASYGTDFKLVSSPGSGSHSVGLHVRKVTVDDLPLVSGYNISIDPSGALSMQDAGGTHPNAGTVSNFDATRLHDLRVVTRNLSGQTVIRPYVDGVKYPDWIDSTPDPTGYAALSTYQQVAEFDRARVAESQAPYIALAPLEKNSSPPTNLTVYINDQDGTTGFSETNLELRSTRQFADGSTSTTIYSSTSNPTLMSLFGAWSTPADGTTRLATMNRSVEWFQGSASAVVLDFRITDNTGKIGRKAVRY
jgi:hypothetical protein